ncbi:MAG: tRNA pseudouridine(55) synthase TruB [Planctomycetes bacterium]|nr:tRNA pseudouridine(55) synthase TruB [Planctomycetota bacterium]
MNASEQIGILNVAKPAGVTSRAVVDRVGRALGTRRVGHAGTLDPLATGVLVVAVGAATRLVEYVQRLEKRYRGTFLLGRTSPTDDTDGEVTLLPDALTPTLAAIQAAAAAQVGRIEQVPPAFSALKVDGQRAYALARQGAEVQLAARPVDIHSIDIVRYEYPELELDVRCGSGTYIRAIGRDLARAVGSAAVMSQLERTAIGAFRLTDACPWAEVERDPIGRWLLPIERAVEALPRVTLDEEQIRRARLGQTIALEAPANEAELAAFDASGRLISILTQREPGWWKPAKNLG